VYRITNGSLEILKAGLEDEGSYECRASNSIKADITKTVTVEVDGKFFTKFRNNFTVYMYA
jgi:hypothetical protein